MPQTEAELKWSLEAEKHILGKQILSVTYESGAVRGENVLTIWLEGDIMIQPLRDCELNGAGALALVIEDEDGTHTIPGTMRK